MQKASKICVISAIVLWVIAVFALLMTWLGTRFVPVGYDYVSVFDVAGNEWLLPVWSAAIAAVAVGIGLCILLKKRENANHVPFILALVGGILALIVALELKSALPVKVGTQYSSQGITAWRLIWRHLTPVAAGLLTAIAAWISRTANRAARIQAENDAYKEHYDLSGDPLFADGQPSTIGLETYAEDFGVKRPARKLKRSLRKKNNK